MAMVSLRLVLSSAIIVAVDIEGIFRMVKTDTTGEHECGN
jgi:hypothetical protein